MNPAPALPGPGGANQSLTPTIRLSQADSAAPTATAVPLTTPPPLSVFTSVPTSSAASASASNPLSQSHSAPSSAPTIPRPLTAIADTGLSPGSAGIAGEDSEMTSPVSAPTFVPDSSHVSWPASAPFCPPQSSPPESGIPFPRCDVEYANSAQNMRVAGHAGLPSVLPKGAAKTATARASSVAPTEFDLANDARRGTEFPHFGNRANGSIAPPGASIALNTKASAAGDFSTALSFSDVADSNFIVGVPEASAAVDVASAILAPDVPVVNSVGDVANASASIVAPARAIAASNCAVSARAEAPVLCGPLLGTPTIAGGAKGNVVLFENRPTGDVEGGLCIYNGPDYASMALDTSSPPKGGVESHAGGDNVDIFNPPSSPAMIGRNFSLACGVEVRDDDPGIAVAGKSWKGSRATDVHASASSGCAASSCCASDLEMKEQRFGGTGTRTPNTSITVPAGLQVNCTAPSIRSDHPLPRALSAHALESARRREHAERTPDDAALTIGRVAVHMFAPDAAPGAASSPCSPAGMQKRVEAFCKKLGLPAIGARPVSRAMRWLAAVAGKDRDLRWSVVPVGGVDEAYTFSAAVWAGVWDRDEVVRGSEASRQLLWHLRRFEEELVGANDGFVSSCGFVGCRNVCVSGVEDKARFRLDRVFERCETPKVPDIGLSGEPAREGLLVLPDEAIEMIALYLDSKSLMAFGSTCRFLRKSTVGYVTGLNLRLYPHQTAAIWRMVDRERAGKEKIPGPLYAVLPRVECDSKFYVSLDDGTVRKGEIEHCVEDCRGGLYCDEPGLGKTVTALALVLKTLGQQAKPPVTYTGVVEEEPEDDDEDDKLDGLTGEFAYNGDNMLSDGPGGSRSGEDSDLDVPISGLAQRSEAARELSERKRLARERGDILRALEERKLMRRNKRERLRKARGGLRRLYYCPQRADRFQVFGMDEIATNGGRRGSQSARRSIRRPDFLDSKKGAGSLPSVGLRDVPIYLSGATLCVVPDALVKHWEGQITQHLDGSALRVLTVKRAADVPPAVDLAFDYDIVIVNFTTMSSVSKRMRSDAPPLLCVRFLRVLMDEGHKLGNSATSITDFSLVSKLIRAERRWILTGTPAANVLVTDVRTLLPLLRFIRDEAFGLDDHAWSSVIQKPYEVHQPEALGNLEKLLNRLVIRSSKENVDVIPACVIKNVFLDFSKEAAEGYNDLVMVGLRNMVLTDWFRSTHKESLLNSKNSKQCIEFLENLRSSCCFGGVIRSELDSVDIGESLKALYEFATEGDGTALGLLKDVRKSDQKIHIPLSSNWYSNSFYASVTTPSIMSLAEIEAKGGASVTPKLMDSRNVSQSGLMSENSIGDGGEVGDENEEKPLCFPRKDASKQSGSRLEFRGVLKKIGERLSKGCDCPTCGRFCRLPMLSTCGHCVCLDCYVNSKTRCSVLSCDLEYAIDSKGVASKEQELQPVLFTQGWKPDWETSVSAKMDYLVRRLDEIKVRTVWNGTKWVQKRPKVIVYTQFHMHRLLLSLTFKNSEKYREAYVELFVNEQEVDTLHRGGSRLRKQTASDRIGRLLDSFEYNDEKQILLIETVHSSVGLDLSFCEYVFLLEPVWNPALEKQVIARAHRIGAKETVQVERLAMRNSIEHDMLEENIGAASQGSGVSSQKKDVEVLRRSAVLTKLKSVTAGPAVQGPSQSAALNRAGEAPSCEESAVEVVADPAPTLLSNPVRLEPQSKAQDDLNRGRKYGDASAASLAFSGASLSLFGGGNSAITGTEEGNSLDDDDDDDDDDVDPRRPVAAALSTQNSLSELKRSFDALVDSSGGPDCVGASEGVSGTVSQGNSQSQRKRVRFE